MAITTLKKRSEFLRLRGGARYASPLLVLETKPRDGEGSAAGPRFGFTITKQIGTAVVRNRLRRRLKAAVGVLAATLARPGHDYVVVTRQGAAASPYAALEKDLERAFRRVHETTGGTAARPRDGAREGRPRRKPT